MDDIAGFYSDALGYVLYAFPWGEEGTALEKHSGPDEWQRGVLNDLSEGTISADAAVQIAVASGHGIGKTALIAWIILWFMSTRAHPQVVVTSNTGKQLSDKTWRELAKWHKQAINGHWFEWTATRFYYKGAPETWFASAIPWSKERSEAFAGTHEENVLVLFDEASLIDDAIWEVTEGAMTQKGAFWVAFGNPTRNTGRFRECFKKFRHRWLNQQIDSRTAKMANNEKIEQWITDYGEDSDFVRIRVKGEFPRASSNQLISSELVEVAAGRVLHPSEYLHAPKILAVDVARFGDDQSVIIRRQGLAVSGLKKFRELDTMQLANHVAREIREWEPDAVFIDVVGIGAGVVDRLRQLGFNVIGVNVGEPAQNVKEFFNLRAEIWCAVRDWLKAGGWIPDDPELKDDLIGPEYGFDSRGRIQLEKKEDMKSRGLASPDSADALALTFSYPVAPKQFNTPLPPSAGSRAASSEWDPFDAL